MQPVNCQTLKDTHSCISRSKQQISSKSASLLSDIQQTKTTRLGRHNQGYDSAKHIKGCRSRIVSDTMDPFLTVIVLSANVHDGKGALRLIATLLV